MSSSQPHKELRSNNVLPEYHAQRRKIHEGPCWIASIKRAAAWHVQFVIYFILAFQAAWSILDFLCFPLSNQSLLKVACRKRKPRDPSLGTMSILPLCTQALMKICEVRRSTIPPAPEAIRANSRLLKDRTIGHVNGANMQAPFLSFNYHRCLDSDSACSFSFSFSATSSPSSS